ncbi:hypothetical protein ASPCADRAFT_168057, partial [Aspergillus carbonarius ITEM 5010]
HQKWGWHIPPAVAVILPVIYGSRWVLPDRPLQYRVSAVCPHPWFDDTLVHSTSILQPD